MKLHDWLMFFHVLGSIIWVGAVILMNVMMERASLSDDRTSVLRLVRDLDWVGPRLIGASSAVVLGAGIWLVFVEEDIVFSQLWIWLALVLVGVNMLLNGIYSAPEGKRILRLADARGTEDHEVRRRVSRLVWLARFDVLILVAVVGLMVFKPGGPSLG